MVKMNFSSVSKAALISVSGGMDIKRHHESLIHEEREEELGAILGLCGLVTQGEVGEHLADCPCAKQ